MREKFMDNVMCLKEYLLIQFSIQFGLAHVYLKYFVFNSLYLLGKLKYKICSFSTHKQVLIVQYGKMAFSTKSLTLEQWLWCLFLGIGTLLWGQLVTTVPTRKIPKILS